MIHVLFNNVFVEKQMNIEKDKDLAYPINSDNEHVLLYALDVYDKAQSIFSINKPNSQEYLDVVNYIELNLTKPDVLCKILSKN
jgi:hypothetical protein